MFLRQIALLVRLSISVGALAAPFAVASGGGAVVLEPGATRVVQLSFTLKKTRNSYAGSLPIESSDPSALTRYAIKTALEAAGIAFANDGAESVSLKRPPDGRPPGAVLH